MVEMVEDSQAASSRSKTAPQRPVLQDVAGGLCRDGGRLPRRWSWRLLVNPQFGIGGLLLATCMCLTGQENGEM